MTEYYTRSDGTKVAIDFMAFPHLQAATKGLEAIIFKHPERADELAAMRARLATLEAEFTAKVDRLKAENFGSSGRDGFGWVIVAPLGSVVTVECKTEAAAWARLIALREGGA